MNEKMNEAPYKVLDLANDTYNSMINVWMWGAQRLLEFNKVMVSQLEISQKESRKYVDDMNGKLRQGMQMFQELYQEGYKNYSANLNNWKATTEAAAADLNQKFDQLQPVKASKN